MSFFKASEIEKILAFAIEAGEIAAQAFLSKDFFTERKTDNSQVTTADIAVSKFLREKLGAEFPQIPIICEEGDLRKIDSDVFFLIDPIDGTSSFISGSVEFAVNIALVENKKAVFGLIYAPLFENGKMIFSDEEDQIILWDKSEKRRILTLNNPEFVSGSKPLRIVTSARTKDSDIEFYISKIHPNSTQNFKVEKLSSAVKFFRLLEKDVDLYLHFRPSMEWDTAAGQALVELMGGKVKNLFSNQNEIVIEGNLEYKKPDFSNQAFVAFIDNF
ncbi:MAG: 3'(2'),5'-bisphosphate nucleotidase CysQ [Pseudomonadota bacterium]